MDKVEDKNNSEQKKPINLTWIAIAVGVIVVGFLIALNNRYEVTTLDQCDTGYKWYGEARPSCIKVFDKWTGASFKK